MINKGLGIFFGIEFRKFRNLLRVWGVYSLISPRGPPPFWGLSPEGYLIVVIDPPTALLMVERLSGDEPACGEDKPQAYRFFLAVLFLALHLPFLFLLRGCFPPPSSRTYGPFPARRSAIEYCS